MKKAQKVALTLVTGLALIAGYITIRDYGLESTDDAQVEGRIVNIASRVSGQVQKVFVTDNQVVKAGDPLVELDKQELQSRVAAAQAELSAARAALSSSESDVAAATSRLKLADIELDRIRTLGKSGVVSQSEVDTRKAQYDQAKAAYDQAMSRLGGGKGEGGAPGAALAKVQQAEAALELAKVNLSYTTITAPISGVISRKNVEVGQILAPMTNLMAIVDLNDVWVVANFKEDQLKHMKVGQPTFIKVDTYKGEKFEGEVSSIAAATGAKFSLIPPDNASGNFVKVVQRIPVFLHFKNFTNSPENALVLRPGMSAVVSIKTN